MVFKRVLAFAVVAFSVTFAAAGTTGSKTSDTSKCPDGSFSFTAIKECCLPENGSSGTTPPKGKSCPSSRYWNEEQSCCVPSNPIPPNSPPPQCSSGSWEEASQCCVEPSQPTTTPSKPSATPNKSGGQSKGGYSTSFTGKSSGSYGRRTHTSRSVAACPKGLDACPILGLTSGDYECLDTTAELESCGGCASIGQGQDCAAIEGAWNVGCELGNCIVYTCSAGFMLSADSNSCIAL